MILTYRSRPSSTEGVHASCNSAACDFKKQSLKMFLSRQSEAIPFAMNLLRLHLAPQVDSESNGPRMYFQASHTQTSQSMADPFSRLLGLGLTWLAWVVMCAASKRICSARHAQHTDPHGPRAHGLSQLPRSQDDRGTPKGGAFWGRSTEEKWSPERGPSLHGFSSFAVMYIPAISGITASSSGFVECFKLITLEYMPSYKCRLFRRRTPVPPFLAAVGFIFQHQKGVS